MQDQGREGPQDIPVTSFANENLAMKSNPYTSMKPYQIVKSVVREKNRYRKPHVVQIEVDEV